MPTPKNHPHRLAAILFTDIVGYTAMMQSDEQSAVAAVNRHQQVLEGAVAEASGEVLNYFGDGSLNIFSSAVGAVRAAMKIQEQLREQPVVPLRIGIHIGEVSFDNGKIFGDGVNVASRIESLGQEGTVLFSRHVFDKIRNRTEFQATSLGHFSFKNVDEPLEVFALSNEGFPVPKRSSVTGKLKAGEKGQSRLQWKMVVGAVALALLFAFLGTKLNGWIGGPSAAASPRYYQILLPTDHAIEPSYNPNNTFSHRQFDISPSGDHLVFVGKQGDQHTLFLRAMDGWDSKMIAGTENAYHPFFSPDGQWIGFYADKKLKKISLADESPTPIVICDISLPYGADWGTDNTILFVNNESDAIFRVSADGGSVSEVFHVNSSDANLKLGGFAYVKFLPKAGQFIAADEDDFIVVFDLVNNRQILLPIRGNNPRYFESGHLVYTRFVQLFIVPFDLEDLQIKGSPELITTNIKTLTTGVSQLAFSSNGLLAYVPGAYDKNSRLTKIHRNGQKETLPFPANNFGTFQIPPDGQRLAVEVTAFNADEIWVYHLEDGSTTKLTLTGNNYGMAWTPDGTSVAFLSNRNGGWGLYRKSYQGVSPAEKILDRIFRPYHYSPNGEWLIGGGIHAVQFGDSVRVDQLTNSKFSESQPAFSPDGKWFAYHSDESGQYEVYVQPFPLDGRRWQVSKGGGGGAIWSQGSNEIFYENWPQVNVVPYSIDEYPTFSDPQEVFSGNYVSVGGHSYGVMPDGQSFIVLEAVDTTRLFTEIRIVENWLEVVDD